jgi:large subunit ribosomal protein L25
MAKKTAKEKTELRAEKRKVLGRKVKKLREEDILPANVYGKGIKSLALQLDLKTFLPVFEKEGETGLIQLRIKGEKKIRPVLIHNVQFGPVSDQPIHADFYQVDLKQKVTTEIPVETVGESPAVKEKNGVLFQPLAEIEVEALPAELPDKFEVSLGDLKEIGDMVSVGDLRIPKGVKVLTSENEILAKVEAPEEEEEEVKPEAEVVEGEVAPEEITKEEKKEKPEETEPAEEPVGKEKTAESEKTKVEKKEKKK